MQLKQDIQISENTEIILDADCFLLCRLYRYTTLVWIRSYFPNGKSRARFGTFVKCLALPYTSMEGGDIRIVIEIQCRMIVLFARSQYRPRKYTFIIASLSKKELYQEPRGSLEAQ